MEGPLSSWAPAKRLAIVNVLGWGRGREARMRRKEGSRRKNGVSRLEDADGGRVAGVVEIVVALGVLRTAKGAVWYVVGRLWFWNIVGRHFFLGSEVGGRRGGKPRRA